MNIKTLNSQQRPGPLCTILPCCLLWVTIQLQAQASLQGMVTDSEQNPISEANVLLLEVKDSSLVKGALTNSNGLYQFDNVDPGKYFLNATYLGLEEAVSPVITISATETLNIEPLQMNEMEEELGEIQVVAKKPLFEQKIDRLIINVATSITSAGSSALDILIRSPGIIVDQQNSNLSIGGKDGVVLMLNGKISRLPVSAVVQMLAGMNAGSIERIELITTPPANLDADGNAGFINIVFKENAQFGTNGSFTATLGYGKKPVTAASININHRKGRFNFYGDYSFAQTNMTQDMQFYRRIIQDGKEVESYMNTDREALRRSHNGRLGIDYEASTKTTIGMIFSTFSKYFEMDALNTTSILSQQRLDTVIKIYNDERSPLSNFTANLNLNHSFNKEQVLSLNMDYVYYNDANTDNYHILYYDHNALHLRDEYAKTSKTTPIYFWVGSADYTQKINQFISLDVGIKTTYSKFTNDVQVQNKNQNSWVFDPDLTAFYSLNENIQAAYTNFNIQFNKKTSSKIGLRFEFTDSNLGTETVKDIVDLEYGNLFPSLFLSHSLNEDNILNLSYNRRITRPAFNDLAPFVYFLDPNTFFTGNPALQPSISNTIKSDYLYKRLIFSFAFTNESNPITRNTPLINTHNNKQVLFSENQNNKRIFALTAALPLKIATWWNTQNSISGMYEEMDANYKEERLILNQESININSMHTFFLPENFSVEINSYYQSGGLYGIYYLKGRGSADIGVQKKLEGKSGAIRLSVSDVFGPPLFQPSVNLIERNLIFNGRYRFTNTIFKLNYSKKFGNDNARQMKIRTTASEEERQRVNQN